MVFLRSQVLDAEGFGGIVKVVQRELMLRDFAEAGHKAVGVE